MPTGAARTVCDAAQDHVSASCDGHQPQMDGRPLRMQQTALRSRMRSLAAKVSLHAAKGRASTGALPATSAPAEPAALRPEASKPLSGMQLSVLNAPLQISSSPKSTSSANVTAACEEGGPSPMASLQASADPRPAQHRALHTVASDGHPQQMEPTIKTHRTHRASKHLANTSQAKQQPASADPSGVGGGQCLATRNTSSTSGLLAARTPAAPSSLLAGRSQAQERPLQAGAMLASQICHGQQQPVQHSAAASQVAGQDQAQHLHGDAMQTRPEQLQPNLKTYKTRSARLPEAARVPLHPSKGVRKGQRPRFVACPSSGHHAQDGVDPSSQGAASQGHQQPRQASGQAQRHEQTQTQHARMVSAPSSHMQPPLKTYRTRAARAKAAAAPGQGAAAASCPALPSSLQQPQHAGPIHLCWACQKLRCNTAMVMQSIGCRPTKPTASLSLLS